MRFLTLAIMTAAMAVPAAAQAGHYGHYAPKTYSSTQLAGGPKAQVMKVQNSNGVKIYRGQPKQYAPGQLQSMIAADRQDARNKELKTLLTEQTRLIEKQSDTIEDLKTRIVNLELTQERRVVKRQFINGFGFGDNFISAQNSPGFPHGNAFRQGLRVNARGY